MWMGSFDLEVTCTPCVSTGGDPLLNLNSSVMTCNFNHLATGWRIDGIVVGELGRNSGKPLLLEGNRGYDRLRRRLPSDMMRLQIQGVSRLYRLTRPIMSSAWLKTG